MATTSVFSVLRASNSLPKTWSCCMQWAHLPPRKKRTTTFRPLWSASVQSVARRYRLAANGSAGHGDQASGPRVVRSIRSAVASSVGGSGGRRPAPCRPSSRRRSAPSRWKTGTSRSAVPGQRLELAVGLLRLLVLADGVEDLDEGGERRDLVGLLLDGRLRGRSRRSRSSGRSGGRGPAPRGASRSPWRTARRRRRRRPWRGAGSLPAPRGPTVG